MNPSQLREKSQEELQAEVEATLKELLNLRLQKAMGQAQKPNLSREARRKIARIKTIMKEKGAL